MKHILEAVVVIAVFYAVWAHLTVAKLKAEIALEIIKFRAAFEGVQRVAVEDYEKLITNIRKVL